MFIGGNLTNLRIMHGLSRKQLAERLVVSEQAVWQYENNSISPKMPTIIKLQEIFGVKSKYFYSLDVLAREEVSDNVELSKIAYRSKEVSLVSRTVAEAKYIEYLNQLVSDLISQISIPTGGIVRIRDEISTCLCGSEEDRNTQICKAASLARKMLGFSNDTNENLAYLIEKSGVFIFEKSIGEEVDAYSLWTKNDRAFIILGNLKRSSVRRNFDIAHELAHLLIHTHLEFNHLDRKEHKMAENEANLFAGAFLLPEEEFVADMETVYHKTNPDAYIDLKKKWGTSLQVLGYRSHNLGLIDAKSHRNFYAAIHRKGYLQLEPLDESLVIQKPMKVKTIIDFIFKNELLDIKFLIENEWKVEVSFFQRLTGIDKEFFDNYIIKEKEFDFGTVIDFPSSRANTL